MSSFTSTYNYSDGSISTIIYYDNSQSAATASSVIVSNLIVSFGASVTSITTTSGGDSVTTSASNSTSISAPSGLSTSTRSSSISTPSPPPAHTNKHLTSGAVAGVAIATGIVGAVLAAIAVFFIMSHRRRNSHHSKYESDYAGARATTRSRRVSSDQIAGEKPIATTNVSLILPQPLDDKTVAGDVEKFFKFIEGHVDSGFYHDKPSGSIVTGDVRLGQRSALLPSGISSQPGFRLERLLVDQRSRQSAITALICAEALSGIDFSGETEKSLLPSIVTSFIRSTNSKLQTNQANRLSLSQWRTSTAFLLGDNHNGLDQVHQDRASANLLKDLNEILRPFASSQHEEKRNADLISIFKRAERLGSLLLSQPAEWVFEWRCKSSKGQSAARGQSRLQPEQVLVVFPGLLKLTDNSATALDKPRMVLEPRSMREADDS